MIPNRDAATEKIPSAQKEATHAQACTWVPW